MSDRANGNGESRDERLNRELIELLNELRVALPGVQVLFAFLLAVPFTQRFDEITSFQKNVFMVALLATAAGTIMMIAPTAFHRIRWREHDKEALLRISNKLALVGTVFLAIAMSATVFLITDLIFKAPVTAIVTSVIVLMFAWFWYAWPLLRKVRDREGGS